MTARKVVRKAMERAVIFNGEEETDLHPRTLLARVAQLRSNHYFYLRFESLIVTLLHPHVKTTLMRILEDFRTQGMLKDDAELSSSSQALSRCIEAFDANFPNTPPSHVMQCACTPGIENTLARAIVVYGLLGKWGAWRNDSGIKLGGKGFRELMGHMLRVRKK
jgi:hypothetical protein